MNRARLVIAATLFLVITCAIVGSTVTPNVGAVSKAPTSPQDLLKAYCEYNPDEPVFRAGKQVLYHPTQSPVMDIYFIRLPLVTARFTRSGITLLEGDRVSIRACGCVQTGGEGDTWKRYVNPSGPDSDKLYHGAVATDNFIIIPPAGNPAPCCRSSPTIPGTLRISDMIDAQNRGFQFQIRKQTTLTLAYEDGVKDYGDNGYEGHDDGTEQQCRGVGGAALEITVRHTTN